MGQLRREIRDALGQNPLPKTAVETVFDAASQFARTISERLPLAELSKNAPGLGQSLRRIESLATRASKIETPEHARVELVNLRTEVENVRLELQVLRNESILIP
jgi:hypothetical protein